MTLKDSVQTAILVVGIFSLLIFCASYYFVLIDPDSSNYPLKEALSITASFFGGFATLTAAYIASRLFNDWKDQQRHQNALVFAQTTLQSYKTFKISLELLEDEVILLNEFLQDNDLATDNNFINEFYEKLTDEAYQMLTTFHYFHDDILDFWYVSISSFELGDILERWVDDIYNIHKEIHALNTENNISDNIKTVEKILLPIDNESDSYLNVVKDVILKPLRLEG